MNFYEDVFVQNVAKNYNTKMNKLKFEICIRAGNNELEQKNSKIVGRFVNLALLYICRR